MHKCKISLIAGMGIFPIILYFFIFCILTYPLILKFSTHFFSDTGDGLLNVWNIWWVNKAVTEFHQSPWHTFYLHYPFGVSLLGHTLNPFNGFMAIPLLKFLTLVQAHNFIVVFSFVMGGVTAFLLSYYFTKSYLPSLIAGAIFTFSNYHFAHAEGHLNLVSLEWIPIFVLCWYIFMIRPSVFIAVCSSLILFLIFLCDYYYFFYCVLAGGLAVIWYAVKERSLFFLLKRRHLIPFITFSFATLFTAVPFIVSLLSLNKRDPFIGSPPEIHCLDLFAPFIPGGHWRFARLTECYWSKLPGSIHENSLHIGFSVLFLLIYVWIKRKKLRIEGLGLLYILLIFFFLMSLGPVLQIWEREIYFVRLPYNLLKNVFPNLKFSNPILRIVVMIAISIVIILFFIYIKIRKRGLKTKGLGFLYPTILFLAFLSLEAGLHILGEGVLFIKLPYLLLEKIFPFLRLSSCSSRMMVMVILSASLISAIGFNVLFQKLKGRLFVIALLALLFLEYLPRPMPASRIPVPGYIKFLKDLSENGAIVDVLTVPALSMYYQTIHQRPMAFGDISRIPKSIEEKNDKLRQLVRKKDYSAIHSDYNFRYLITDDIIGNDYKMLYDDGKVKVYDLKHSGN